MKHFTVSPAPFFRNRSNTTRKIMRDVLIALAPCFLASVFFFGYHVVINLIVCLGACFGAELLYELIQKGFRKENIKNASCFDLSCLVTGALIALTLPSKIVVTGWNLNFYADGFRAGGGAGNVLFSFDTVIVCVLGSIFAICLVKMLFGGIGRNFMNPAAAARMFLLLCFAFTAVNTVGLGFTASSGATWLAGDKSTAETSMFLQMLLGNRGTASVGETSMIAILAGGVYLCARKVIDFRIPLIGLGSFMLFTLVFDGIIARNLFFLPGELAGNVWANLLAGGFVFGLVFMATDYSTTPNTTRGHAIFVCGYALITVLIRSFGGYPEGAFFAILLMNIFTPLIDRYVIPKPFGYIKGRSIRRSAKGKKGAEVNV